jgi:glycerol-3-phosphate dehydrogenase
MTPAWQSGGRERIPALVASRHWDVLIIGGGITGTGILLEAARHGLHALLVEQRDFASGASSCSSKLVHGGLRYLKQGKLRLTRDSVREREHLLQVAAGLVTPQSFAFPLYQGRPPGRALFAVGLALYDLMAGQRSHRYYRTDEFLLRTPHIETSGLQGGFCYADAKTDDARLVLRVLQEAVAAGGSALNYMAVTQLLRTSGKADGAQLLDVATGTTHEVRARVVINATGAWGDVLRPVTQAGPKLRPLRGSHLIFPAWRLPVAQAVSLLHPQDGRPVFAFPWEGVTLVGTTDVDHHDIGHAASITAAEVAYLMAALQFQFSSLALTEDDIIATYAGVRPVIDSGQADPSREAREHAIWLEDGLLTVTGGKLTTFRLMALDALKHAAPLLPGWQAQLRVEPVFASVPALLPGSAPSLSASQRLRLEGRYGCHAATVLALAHEDELETIPGTETLWAELRWAACHEAVLHLDDLLLRRTRIGLLLRHGATALLPRVRSICQSGLGWDDARWKCEQTAYLALWHKQHGVPESTATSS